MLRRVGDAAAVSQLIQDRFPACPILFGRDHARRSELIELPQALGDGPLPVYWDARTVHRFGGPRLDKCTAMPRA